jgi:hypothetical protein
MSIPQALMTGADMNESQDLLIETDVLEPNVLNSSQAVFVIPKKGTVLDSKSALKMRVNWEGYADATDTDLGGKLFSGLLGMIKNTRLYASGQLISRLDNAGEKIHLDRQFNDQEYKEQYDDTKHGSNQGFYVADGLAQSGESGAIINSDENGGQRSNAGVVTGSKYPFRAIGKSADKNGLEMFVVLDELFPMLKDFPLPVRFLKDEIRIEIDWEQDKSKWIYVAGTAVTDNLASVSIDSVVLFLDYLTYNQELDNETKEQINGPGISIPFRQTAVITKVLSGSAAAQTDLTEDVLLGQEGRAVMKIFVAKKYPNALAGKTNGVNQGNVFQGVCRSEALLNQKYNFVVNDLLVYDRNVENLKESYAYFSYAGERPATCYPEAWGYNATYDDQEVTTDVLYSTNDAGTADQVILGRAVTDKGTVQDGIMGQQNWDSVDLAKFGSKLNPQNAMRIGSTPIIYRNIRDITAADVRTGGAVSLTIFVEYLRLFDLRGGDLSVRDL